MKKKPEIADLRIRVTKQVLKDSLIGLMETKSILDISIKQICEAAGISRSTFYTYYKDQYDLLEQIEEETLIEFDKLLKNYEPINEMPKARELTAMTQDVLLYIAGNSNSVQVLLSENGESSFQRKIIWFFTDLMQRYYLKSQSVSLLDERMLKYYSVFVRDGAIGILQEWFKNGMDLSVADMAKVFSKLVRGALG
ncbi:MAG: TetR/AcrR family transcriptional regulator [Treponema sp.]|jgi:AcrR family transcriptional regulator|nr:TetR/AcrR family transcriptional regulator [Treponema sp.]